jgi:hypothetical protein
MQRPIVHLLLPEQSFSSSTDVSHIASATGKRSFRGSVIAALRPIAVLPAPTFVRTHFSVPWQSPQPNPALACESGVGLTTRGYIDAKGIGVGFIK